MFTMISGKHIEDFSHALINCLLNKPKISAKKTKDLSIRFDPDCVRRKRQLTNNKNQKEECPVRFMLKDVCGFAELQEKAIYGLCYEPTSTKNKDKFVLNKADATNEDKMKIIGLQRDCIIRTLILCLL